MTQEFKADNGVLIVDEEKVTLKFSKIYRKPDTVIPLKEIESFELKKTPSFYFNRHGYISFKIRGDYFDHPMDSLQQVYANTNALVVVSKTSYNNMVVAKNLIDHYKSAIIPDEPATPSATPSSSSSSAANVIEELRKAAELRDAGILSSDEFEQLKRKLMNG
ncbi:SHOCT domain-containing protein [Cohnella mopanensis]|uniref:SHOCT domain-containing protein n=1 Tax=Cohnella mopanensis TaxID=2911966 RepID=UPI001EF8D2A7|nr:SHOCT domain-containing protein [Cohnella mopanensis]